MAVREETETPTKIDLDTSSNQARPLSRRGGGIAKSEAAAGTASSPAESPLVLLRALLSTVESSLRRSIASPSPPAKKMRTSRFIRTKHRSNHDRQRLRLHLYMYLEWPYKSTSLRKPVQHATNRSARNQRAVSDRRGAPLQRYRCVAQPSPVFNSPTTSSCNEEYRLVLLTTFPLLAFSPPEHFTACPAHTTIKDIHKASSTGGG